MKLRSLFSTAFGVTALSIASMAHAQIPSNYNHPISGISIQDNAALTPDTFGFTTGSTVIFLSGGNNAAMGTYSLASVRAFDLLYNNNSAINWTAQSTVPLGDLTFGAQQVWQAESISGKPTGWEDSFGSNGSQKAGNIGPNTSTGLVFQTSPVLTSGDLTAIYGFDIAVTVGVGQVNPFAGGGAFTAPGIATGSVFEEFTAVVMPHDSVVPEPGNVALLVGMGVTGVGFLARRRFSRRK